ncbi:MAG: phage minor capsid protein, partial [Plesiomonas shigelloides]
IGDEAAQFTYATATGTRAIELESAVRQAIGTLAHRTALSAQDARMGEMGVEYVLVSQHMGARPEHAEWQGQVYGYPDELEEVTGYPSDPLGLGQINCRHSFSPYLPGVSPDPAEVIDEEASAEVYAGTQRQRQIERNLRHYKRRLGGNNAALSLDPNNAQVSANAKRDRELIAKWHKESRENVAKYDLTRRGYAERPLR